MPTKTAPPKRAPREPNPLSAEGLPWPSDPSHDQLQAELADLSKPGRVSKDDAEFIDNAPGYSKDQLAHMREYYDL